jgi:hypothetical protein
MRPVPNGDKRGDISQYLVHLTRDNRGQFKKTGRKARENFESILADGMIKAKGIHCLHGNEVKKLEAEVRSKFRVVCFTATPLDQIHNLIGIPGRTINLEAYGYVFDKSFLMGKGAQEAIYINDYSTDHRFRAAFDAVYQKAVLTNFTGISSAMLPFVNVRHSGHDFAWEREWRVVGSVAFEPEDLVCVILPERAHDLREEMDRRGIAVVSPGWSYERVIEAFAEQKRRSMEIWKEKYLKRARGKRPLKLAQLLIGP